MAANSQEALAQLQQVQAQAQDPNTILSGQRQQLGTNAALETVTGLRGAINNTTKLLKQVAPSVMGRTGNSLVTNAQAGRIIQNEEAPISQNLSDQGRQYGQASEDYNRLEDQATKAASGIYQGQQDKLSYAQNLYNTLYKKEQDELARQEAVRQFNEQLALQRQAEARAGKAAGGGGFSLGGGGGLSGGASPAASSSGNALKQKAAADVGQLMNRRGSSDFYREVKAISDSAGYGNTYDQAKLELIKASQPGLFSGGKLRADYISRLINAGF